MYINQTSNEYHHLQVLRIDDHSYDSKPYVRLYCLGKVLYRTPTGYKIPKYNIYVYITGHLMDYALAEIQREDNIFVVGRTTMGKLNPYNTVRALVAECIYREDWLNFYTPGGNVNPNDTSDVFNNILTEDE